MREILFKAKHIHAFNSNSYLDGQWVEGFLSAENYINDGVSDVLIEPNTICQYTGLTDKNGNKIWENDVVKDDRGNIYKAFWQERYYQFSWICVKSDLLPIGAKWDLWSLSRNGDLEVIGNTFDNADLLKGE